MISTVISLSLIFGVLILLFHRKNLPILLSTIVAVFSFVAFQKVDFVSGNLELIESYTWFSDINVSLGVDALSLSLIGVSTLFLLLICVTPFISQAQKGLIFLAHGLVVGALSATNLILFFVFFEGMLIPLYFIIGKFGGEKRVLAATRFLLFSVFGSVFLLASILFITVKAGSTTIAALTDQLQLSPKEEFFLFLGFFIAFAVKVPLFPFYSWQPLAYRESPTAGTVYMAAVLSKVGIYGLLRFVFPLFPIASVECAPMLAWIGALGCLGGALVAWNQRDIKNLLAYSSISHLSLCLLGIASWNSQATTGVAFQLVSHALCTGGLFYLVGYMTEANRETRIERYSGIASYAPRLSFLFFIVSFGSIALPLTSGFVGEFLILSGSFRVFPAPTLVALGSVVIGAIYMLSLMREMFFGLKNEESVSVHDDLSLGGTISAGILAVLVLVLGLYPQSILPSLQSSIDQAVVSSSERESLRGSSPKNKNEGGKLLNLVGIHE